MGAVMTCSLGLGLAAPPSASAAAGSSGIRAGRPGTGAAVCTTCVRGTAAAAGGAMRLIRTASSPSLISISAMPDSSRSSISFLIFRMSMPGIPPAIVTARAARSGAARESLRGGTHRQLVAEGSETGDDTDGDVGEIGMSAKWLARLRVGKMQLDERQVRPEQRIAQRDARVGKGAGVDDHETNALGRGALNALDE